ncbi:MAG: succinate dehydrogenase, hydrophobic membrane anchor protein [Pseudomonadota bacterium]
MSRRATGLRAWVVQRLSGLYLGLFFMVFMGHLAWNPPTDFGAWRTWLTQAWVMLGLYLFLASLLLHAWVGIRDVLMDYVPILALRLLLLTLCGFLLIACGFWMMQLLILARLASGPS